MEVFLEKTALWFVLLEISHAKRKMNADKRLKVFKCMVCFF